MFRDRLFRFRAPDEGGAGAAASSSAGADASSGGATADSSGAASGQQEEQFDRDRAMQTITHLREIEKQGKAAAAENAKLKAELDKFREAQMTEQERKDKKAAEDAQRAEQATSVLRQERLERQIERHARQLNIVDEEAAVRLLDHGQIEFDADGRPTNVKDLLDALVAAKPYLVGQATAATQEAARATASSGRPAAPARGAAGSGTFTTSQIQDRAFWEANRDAIMTAYNEGRIVQG